MPAAEPPMDAIDRMFHLLVRTIREKHPTFLRSSFTVGDLHQLIIPYRHYRRELGIDTNQEYELALMELVSGARGFLDVDDRLKDQLGKELKSSSPDPSRVREFADAQVSLSGTAPGVRDATAAQKTPVTPMRSLAQPESPDRSRCHYCGGELPLGRVLHFCPHCGQNLQVLNCKACGAEVEAGWKFCVACGRSVT